MIYKEEDIEKLKDSLDIVDIVGEKVELKRAGANYKGLCPFHDEKTPSFSVSPVKNIYKCFGCGESGDALNFYMKTKNLDFITAIEELAKREKFALEAQDISYKRDSGKKDKLHLVMEEVVEFFSRNLLLEEGKEAKNYLLNRGLTEEFCKEHKLGYSLNSWHGLLEYMKEKGYSEEELLDLGLIKNGEKSQYDTFRDRVMFPIYSYQGKIIGFGGRLISTDRKDNAKYLNSPETILFDKGRNLYGLINRGERIRKKGYALLMEGYMDVLAAHSYGFDNSVATLGTACTIEQAKLLKRYTNNVVIAYDMDSAGRKAVKRAAYILKKQGFNIKVLSLKGAKDPDEYLKKYGLEKFTESLKESKEIFDFLYKDYSSEVNLNDVISKKALIERFREFFNSLEDELEKSIYIDKLSLNVDVEKKILKDIFTIKKEIVKEKSIARYKEPKSKEEKTDKLEYETIKLLLKTLKNLEYFLDKKIEDTFLQKVLMYLKENKERDLEIDKLVNKDDFDNFEKQKIIELSFSLFEIEDEEVFFEELKFAWERRERVNKEMAIAQRLKEEDLSEMEKRSLILERVKLITELKNNF